MRNLVYVLAVLVVLSFAAGCVGSNVTVTFTPVPPTDTPIPTQTATPTAVPPTATPFPFVEQSAINAHCGETYGLERLTLRPKADVSRPIAFSDFQDIAHHCYHEVGFTALVSDLIAQGVVAVENGTPEGAATDYVINPVSETIELFVSEFILGARYVGRKAIDVGVMVIELPTQRLQDVFPPEFDGVVGGLVSNLPYWTEDGNRYIHIDVGLPPGFTPEVDYIRIPAGGEITYFWSWGEEGNGIVIEPYPPLEGIDEVVRAIGFDPQDLEYVQYHLAHIFVDEGVGIEEGAFVITGQDIGRPVDQVSRFSIDEHWTNKFSYVIRLLVDGMEYQINPCWLPHDHNQPDWCYVCYPPASSHCFPDQFTPQPSP